MKKLSSNLFNTTKAADLRRTTSKDRIRLFEERLAKEQAEADAERVVKVVPTTVQNAQYVNDENDEMIVRSRKPKLTIPTAAEAKQFIKPGMVSASLYNPDKKRKLMIAKKPAKGGKPSQIEEVTVQQLTATKKITQKKITQERIGRVYSNHDVSSHGTEDLNILGDLSNVN